MVSFLTHTKNKKQKTKKGVKGKIENDISVIYIYVYLYLIMSMETSPPLGKGYTKRVTGSWSCFELTYYKKKNILTFQQPPSLFIIVLINNIKPGQAPSNEK